MHGHDYCSYMCKRVSGQQAAEVAIIENVQRADLNPMEEAMAYQTLIDEFNTRRAK